VGVGCPCPVRYLRPVASPIRSLGPDPSWRRERLAGRRCGISSILGDDVPVPPRCGPHLTPQETREFPLAPLTSHSHENGSAYSLSTCSPKISDPEQRREDWRGKLKPRDSTTTPMPTNGNFSLSRCQCRSGRPLRRGPREAPAWCQLVRGEDWCCW
jgi:hypothetical protein